MESKNGTIPFDIKIKKDLELIESHAFFKTGLKTATIPKSVKTLGISAFMECRQLKEIYLEGRKAPVLLWYIGVRKRKHMDGNRTMPYDRVVYCSGYFSQGDWFICNVLIKQTVLLVQTIEVMMYTENKPD